MGSTYLGLDFSTQQLKAVVLNEELQILHETHVHFDSELPEFRTHGGVVQKKGSKEVTVPTIMWVKALDMLLEKLRVCGVDFSEIVALSGSAQQHGSVYWGKGGKAALASLNPSRFLHEQLGIPSVLSIPNSPVWMDSSTTAQCRRLESGSVGGGGAVGMARVTGSRAYERFTAAQIAKIAETKSQAYSTTERISLISSFACSIFLGDYAPIDWADGSGMNLLDIEAKDWSDECLELCAPMLRGKLGATKHSYANIGPISPYFVERFGFSPECRVVAFTGDNPASLVGMRLQEGDIAVSLGTSDTVFMWLSEPKTITEGHVLCNPAKKDAFMALLCFKNGSLTRERIRDNSADGSWEIFNELLNNTPRGNFGNMGLYFDSQEILPNAVGDFRYNKAGDKLTRFTSTEVEVRALIEGQFIAKRAHAEDFGFKIGKGTRVLATGGASVNTSILQVLADVFNSPVYVQESTNSAVLGAAYQAKHGYLLGSSEGNENENSLEAVTACLPAPTLVCSPFQDAAEVYNPMITRYRKIISAIGD
ncbi:xylulose kinase [Ischnura elegans]|uniref:xylulose kinase n=1 Tax=Ischnura elegans TaxID=197161 RepID=UPI001ED875E5|nr:xylulose kinase [Ischnura elegans]